MQATIHDSASATNKTGGQATLQPQVRADMIMANGQTLPEERESLRKMCQPQQPPHIRLNAFRATRANLRAKCWICTHCFAHNFSAHSKCFLRQCRGYWFKNWSNEIGQLEDQLEEELRIEKSKSASASSSLPAHASKDSAKFIDQWGKEPVSPPKNQSQSKSSLRDNMMGYGSKGKKGGSKGK